MLDFLKKHNDVIKARVTTQRRLEHELLQSGIEDPALVTKLAIAGPMTRTDFKYIRRKMRTTLQELNIYKAILEDGKLIHGAFANCTALTSVIIPNWTSEIGKTAFSNCKSLTSFTIPKSVTKIGELAFWCCYNLKSIIIPDAVTELGFRTFNNCYSLTSVTLPSLLVKIGGSAFGNCGSLASIRIPDSVTEIGNGAFAHCTSLDTVRIPKTVTKIGDWAFENCTCPIILDEGNPEYLIHDGKIMTNVAYQIRFGEKL